MKAPKGKSPKLNSKDAITLLTEDHKAVQKLLKQYEDLKENDGDDEAKAELAKQICTELAIHAQIEEEIFYPAVREAIEDEQLMDEAEVEHASAKELIAQLAAMTPGDDLYDAKVTVLGEYISHHVKEEQDEMFPQVKKAELDTAALGAELLERKRELQAEMGVREEAEESDDDTTMPQPAGTRKPTARSTK